MPDDFYRRKNGLPGCHEIQKRRWRIQADLEGVQVAERVRSAAFLTKRETPVRRARARDFCKETLLQGLRMQRDSHFPWRSRGTVQDRFSDGLSSNGWSRHSSII